MAPIDPEFKTKLAQLKQRCEAAGFGFEEEMIGTLGPFALVSFPRGRKTRSLYFGEGRIDALLAIPFEELSFVGRYDAVWSHADGSIEALVDSAAGDSLNLKRIAGVKWNEEIPDPVLQVVASDGPTMTLRKPTNLFETLISSTSLLALHIEGLDISQHDQAERTLAKLSNSLFFQLDSLRGAALMLRGLRRARPQFVRRLGGSKEPEFPQAEFDPEPMSLYWYARGANRMPLLQFLAYYQVLEFYFPRYAALDARRRVRNIVKDPLFDPHSDRDITRVLNAGGYASRRGGIGDERSQLKATIQACAEPSMIREYVFDKNNAEFFEKKAVRLTDAVLRKTMTDSELLDAASNRVYDIRCKIVHTKDSGDREEVRLLLPFSSEAEGLGRDIDLLHLIARSALVAGSSPLQLLPSPRS